MWEKTFDVGCGINMQRRDRDMLCFEGGIRDTTATCGIVSNSQNLRIHEELTLLLLK